MESLPIEIQQKIANRLDQASLLSLILSNQHFKFHLSSIIRQKIDWEDRWSLVLPEAIGTGSISLTEWIITNYYCYHLFKVENLIKNGQCHLDELTIYSPFNNDDQILIMALSHDHYDLFEWLLNRGAIITEDVLNQALCCGHIQSLDLLKDKVDSSLWTTLMFECAFKQNLVSFIWLLENILEVNINKSDLIQKAFQIQRFDLINKIIKRPGPLLVVKKFNEEFGDPPFYKEIQDHPLYQENPNSPLYKDMKFDLILTIRNSNLRVIGKLCQLTKKIIPLNDLEKQLANALELDVFM